MTFVLTEAIVIPAGTRMVRDDTLGDGGLRGFPATERGCVQVWIGERSAREAGLIVPVAPVLTVVE